LRGRRAGGHDPGLTSRSAVDNTFRGGSRRPRRRRHAGRHRLRTGRGVAAAAGVGVGLATAAMDHIRDAASGRGADNPPDPQVR